MNKKQINLTFFLPMALLAALFIAPFTSSSDVSAKSLSYNLACKDDSVGLTVTKQEAKHQATIKCKSGARFEYINNSETAKNKVTGKCPGSETIGTDVDVPNGASSRMIMYCVSLSGGGADAHATKTDNTPTVTTKKITPPGKDGDDGGDSSTGEDSDGDDGGDSSTGEDSDGFDPGAGDGCGGAETAVIKCDADNSGAVENNGIWALLLIAVNILTAGVGIIAVGGIVYGAILYTTAEDKADQVKKATDIITNVVIGLVLFALMWAGLNFIIPGGVFA